MPDQWLLKKFDELSPFQLYAILQLRNEVFVVEQHCVFQDADDLDQNAWHLMGFHGDKLICYTRLLAPGFPYTESSIGRVVTSPRYRNQGNGNELMQRSIEQIYELFGPGPIRIGAQLYLKPFYSSLGFEQVSEIYLEDGIEHIYMVKKV